MTNHYRFHCPVKQGAAAITDCETVHSLTMQGKPNKIEDKLCALASLCEMCPVRHAFRRGGPWHKPGDKPRRDQPSEVVDKLPPSLLSYAMRHTTPKHSDYRRAGMWGDEVGIHDQFFRDIQAPFLGQGAQIGRPTADNTKTTTRKGSAKPAPKKPAPKKPAPKKTIADSIQDSGTDMADAVTELARKERAGEASRPEPKAEPQKKKEAPARASVKATAPSTKKLTLAERAKLMREKRKTA